MSEQAWVLVNLYRVGNADGMIVPFSLGSDQGEVEVFIQRFYEFPMPLTWALNVTVQYGTPLEMTFTGLDPEASYGMKVFYPNSFFRAFVGQTALKDETLVNIRAGKVLLADRIAQNPNGKSVRREIEAGREPFWEYDLPKESYQDGTLKVRWEVYDTLKALAVSEVWIMKKE